MLASRNMIRYDPTPEDLTSNFFVLGTNVNHYLCVYSNWVELRIHIHEEWIRD